MLTIQLKGGELWDEINEEFIVVKPQTIVMEHSLVSLAKWESKWHKPFLSKENKTSEQTLDYVRMMTLTQNVDPNVYKFLTKSDMEKINNYIQDPMTATWFKKNSGKGGNKNGEAITAEIIYYWMVALQIPFECQKWHLNRLMTLIHVCNEKNQPPKKMSKHQVMSRNAALNAARRGRTGSAG